MTRICDLRRFLSAVTVVVALFPCTARGQFVGSPPCPPVCAPPLAIQNAMFQNLYVYVPRVSGETWDQHMAAFLQNKPKFGAATPGSSFVNCMDGTSSPCIQGLTSEAIDSLVRELVNSNYFQAMESYGVGPPTFAGEQTLIPACLENLPPSGSASYFDLAAFVSCQMDNTPNLPQQPNLIQLNLIVAPDMTPPTELDGTQLCGSSDKVSFHSAALSNLNVTQYLLNPPFENGLQQCVLSYLDPLGGFFGSANHCLAQGVASQCWAAALGGAVFCPAFDFLFPGLCEVLDAAYVTGCLTEAGVEVTEQAAFGSAIIFTVIPTNPSCYMPAVEGHPRLILGGAMGGARTGGVNSSLDQVAVLISHEMTEAITDPTGLGWLHYGSFPEEYDTGEIADICEPGGLMNTMPSLTSTAFMPFLFLHVSRYWSNANNQCMPQFDASNGFQYEWLDANTISSVPSRPNSVVAAVAGATPLQGGFWAAALASQATDEPNVRVTDLGSTGGPAWHTIANPPQQFGNTIDLGGTEPTLSYSALPPPWPAQAVQMVASSPDDELALELWDSLTGQGCVLCQWPPPTACMIALQQQTPPSAASGVCTANFNAETLTYGLSEPPLDGNVTYALSPASAGTVNAGACNAISPCALSITFANGGGSYTLVATDTITPPVTLSLFAAPVVFPPSLSCSLTFPVNPQTTGSSACVPSSGGNPGSTNFTLTVTVDGCGTVSSAGGNIISGGRSCANSNSSPSSTCNALYSGGTVSLSASSPGGASFVGWGVACSGNAPTCSVNMDQNQTVMAEFEQCPSGTPGRE